MWSPLKELHLTRDEGCIVTLLCRRQRNTMHVVAGSLVIGPRELCTESWVSFASNQGTRHQRDVDRARDHELLGRAQFELTRGDWSLIRSTIPIDDLAPWMDEASSGRVSVKVDETVISAHLALEPAEDLVWLSAHRASSAEQLCAMAGRPLSGWAHAVEFPGRTSETEGQIHIGGGWRNRDPVDELLLFGGMRMSADRRLPALFVVGRLSQDAWIDTWRGASDMQDLLVGVSLDTSRVSIWDLEIEVEESSELGLIYSRRTPLELFPVEQATAARITIRLPILGRGLQRRVQLWHRDGRLLDATDLVRFVERVHVTVTALDHPAGPPLVATTIGATTQQPMAHDRIEAYRRVDREYEQAFHEGRPGRLLVEPEAARDAVRNRLHTARGELLIADPYFGDKEDDWRLLTDVPNRTRILAKEPATVPPELANADLRSTGAKPPFHDRLYLWDEGGIAVGTSPNGLGARLALITSLEPSDIRHFKELFEDWWSTATPPRAGGHT